MPLRTVLRSLPSINCKNNNFNRFSTQYMLHFNQQATLYILNVFLNEYREHVGKVFHTKQQQTHKFRTLPLSN